MKPLNQPVKKQSKYLVNKYQPNSDEDIKDFDDYKKDKSASDSDSTDENKRLDSLRKELGGLNGEEEEEEGADEEEDDTKRSMKLMLKSGIIPDATMIHQARKKREMARQGDFIPVSNNTNRAQYRANQNRIRFDFGEKLI